MTDYLAEALAFGHYHTPCQECGGRGYIAGRFGDIEWCDECDGTGHHRGQCDCGRWDWLMHDASPLNTELACPHCLIMCDNCGKERATVHQEVETCGGNVVERLCANCALLIEGTIR